MFHSVCCQSSSFTAGENSLYGEIIPQQLDIFLSAFMSARQTYRNNSVNRLFSGALALMFQCALTCLLTCVSGLQSTPPDIHRVDEEASYRRCSLDSDIISILIVNRVLVVLCVNPWDTSSFSFILLSHRSAG